MANKTRKRTKDRQRPKDASGGLYSTERNLLLMEETFPRLYHLVSHKFEISDSTQSSPTEVPVAGYDPFSRSIVVTRYESSRKTIEKRSVTLGLPEWPYSKVKEVAQSGVKRDFMVLLNEQDYAERYAEISIPSNGLDQPNKTGVLSMGGTDPSNELITQTSGYVEAANMELWGLSASPTTSPSANPLYAAAWLAPDYDGDLTACPGDAIIGGEQIGAAADEVLSVLTTDNSRFDTENDVTTALAVDSLITSIVLVGTKIVATFANHIDPADVGATAGGIVVYDNGTVSEALLSGSGLATPMYGVAYDRDSDRIVAVGQDGKIVSANIDDLLTLSDLSMTSSPPHLLDIAFGTTAVGYIAAVDGTAWSLTGTITTDISTVVKGSLTPTTLVRVAHLGNEHYAFGGDAGFFSETLDGGKNWTPQALNAGAGTVYAIAGHSWRTMLGINDSFFERSILTIVGDDPNYEMVWRQLDLLGNATLSGNIRDIQILRWMNGYNVFVAVTDAGEVVYAKAAVASC